MPQNINCKPSWHYQLMKHTSPSGESYYAVHEIYNLNKTTSWTENPCEISGESVEDVLWTLNTMIKDIENYGVKTYE